MRPLLLAVLMAAGLATAARAANDSQNIRIDPDSTLVIAPGQSAPPSKKETPPATSQTTAPAAQSTPVSAPAPQPVPLPVVATKPWPENVPSLKPGSDKTIAATAAKNTAPKLADSAGQSHQAQGEQNQVAALPPA